MPAFLIKTILNQDTLDIDQRIASYNATVQSKLEEYMSRPAVEDAVVDGVARVAYRMADSMIAASKEEAGK